MDTFMQNHIQILKKKLKKQKQLNQFHKDGKHHSKLNRNSLFCEVSEEWLTDIQPKLKPASIVKYKNILNTYLIPYFSEFTVETITRSDVSDFANHLLTDGGKKDMDLSPKSVNDVLSVLRSIFLYASRDAGLIVTDINGISVRNQAWQLRILSRNEQKKLEEYLYADLTLCNLGILLCLYTGLRVGELCALKWSDISLEEGVIKVTKSM